MSSARKSHSHCGHRGIFSLSSSVILTVLQWYSTRHYRQMAVGSMKRTKRPLLEVVEMD